MLDSMNVKPQIDTLREAIGREIHIFTPTRTPCTICTAGGFYDSISDASTYIRCPECKGKFWLATTTDNTVLARVHWTTNEAAQITPGGKYFVGDAYAVVDPQYHAIAQAAQEEGGKVVIDGQDMQILRINPEGVPVINRYKLILTGMGARPK
jgi:hypothetical protein